MNFLEIGKDMKIKYSVSSLPYKVLGKCYSKKDLHRGTNFSWQIYGGMFYMETNDQIMQGKSQWLRDFKGRVKLVFLSLILNWVIDMFFEKLIP